MASEWPMQRGTRALHAQPHVVARAQPCTARVSIEAGTYGIRRNWRATFKRERRLRNQAEVSGKALEEVISDRDSCGK